MPEKSNNTLYDRILEKCKNHPFVVVILLAVAVLAGIASVTESWHTLIENLNKEDPSPKVSEQYYSFSGHAISLLLLGKLDAQLQKHIGGTPLVWKNKVFDELRLLHNQFGIPLNSQAFLDSEDADRKDFESIPKSAVFLPATVYREVIFDQETEALGLGDPVTSPEWKVAFVKEQTKSELVSALKQGATNASNFAFSRKVSCKKGIELLAKSGHETVDMFKHISAPGCDGLEFDVVARYLDAGCGGDGWEVKMYLPRLVLRTAVIRNVSSAAIKINKIVFEASRATGIQAAAQMQKIGDVESSVGDGTLSQQDRLIIPLGVHFDARPEGRDVADQLQTYSKVQFTSAELEEAVAGKDAIDLLAYVFENGESQEQAQGEPSQTVIGKIAAARLQQDYGFMPAEQQAQEASIGTILSPKSIEVDGRRRSSHTVQMGGTYISEMYEAGSCPYLYFQEDGGRPVYIGKILIGRDSAKKAGRNVRHVPSWPERIIVSEEELEITYLRSVRAVCEKPDGQKLVRLPVNTDLISRAGQSLLLKKGEAVTAAFEPLDRSQQCTAIYIEVEGHYIPETQAKR